MRPPLPAWPVRAEEFEPAHGLFRRIAHANNQVSIRTLATLVGVNGRFVDPEELLAFCGELPIANLGAVDRATPRIAGNYVSICGQKFSKRDWSLRKGRVCAACLQEAAYHRTWFDLTLVLYCPKHGIPLIEAVENESLASWCPEIGVTPSGRRAEATGTTGAHDVTFERYVLGRMGVVSGFENPVLDSCELFEVIEAAVFLGSASLAPRSPNPSQWTNSHQGRCESVRLGFPLLLEGQDAIRSHLETLFEVSDSQGRLRTADARQRFATRLETLSSSSLATFIRVPCFQIYLKFGIHPRRSARIGKPAKGLESLNRAAASLKLTRRATRELAFRCEMIAKSREASELNSFTRQQIEELRCVLARLISSEAASKLLGISKKQFVRLCAQAGLHPFIRFGPGGGHQFWRQDIESLMIQASLADGGVSPAIPGGFGPASMAGRN